jgi:hypothetical protein
MSPAKRSKAKRPAKAARKSPKKSARPKAATKSAKPTKAKAARPNAAPERRHCAAQDPFGGPCQSVPRLPSKYCTIHSYLDR